MAPGRSGLTTKWATANFSEGYYMNRFKVDGSAGCRYVDNAVASRAGRVGLSLLATLLTVSCVMPANLPNSASAGASAPVTTTAATKATTATTAASAAPISPDPLSQQVRDLSAQQTQPVLNTLQQMTAIESGSLDLAGLAQMAQLIGTRLGDAGMQVQMLASQAPDFHPILKGQKLGSIVFATLKGSGKKSVMLIAHMDTVYLKGMAAKQPFRIDGNRAFGLGISDDKGGVALVLHTVELLQSIGFRDYAELAVLINADEEIGSPGSGAMIAQKGAEYDAVFSFEGGGGERDMVRLATSSIAIATLKVTGRASHAGANPEGGRNALYELAHQILKSKDLGDNAKGLKINWTVAKAGDVRNVIPADATATADIRALANEDLDQIETALRASIKERLIADTKVELNFLRSRPAFRANDASRALARHAVSVFRELGRDMEIRDRATGGGTDAAFAGMRPKGGVLESFGTRGFGAHSNDAEYIFIDSIQPKLYLSTRMVMDVGRGLVSW